MTAPDAALHHLITSLREQLGERDETIRQLKAAMIPERRLPSIISMQPMCELLTMFLFSKSPHVVSRENIFLAVYGGMSETDPKVLDVMLYKARKKLLPYGIKLESRRDSGCLMKADSALKLKALIAADERRAAA